MKLLTLHMVAAAAAADPAMAAAAGAVLIIVALQILQLMQGCELLDVQLGTAAVVSCCRLLQAGLPQPLRRRTTEHAMAQEAALVEGTQDDVRCCMVTELSHTSRSPAP